MTSSPSPPRSPGPVAVVGIPACAKDINEFPFHAAGDKYVRAVHEGTGALPMLIPALGEGLDMEDLAGRLDGLFLTGSPSNVEPERYGGGPELSAPPHDPQRDATTLPLIRACVAAGVPLFAVCRGIQELNVALGGTLYPRVHEVPGKLDHRGGPGTREERYRLKHTIALTQGGLLHRIAQTAGVGAEPMINSLHGQGIDRLAPGLTVEGVAPDGIIEAVSVTGATTFALGVQWHPEWRFRENALSTALFDAFGAAVRARAAARMGRGVARAAE